MLIKDGFLSTYFLIIGGKIAIQVPQYKDKKLNGSIINRVREL
jgi:hypothetical protein